MVGDYFNIKKTTFGSNFYLDPAFKQHLKGHRAKVCFTVIYHKGHRDKVCYKVIYLKGHCVKVCFKIIHLKGRRVKFVLK